MIHQSISKFFEHIQGEHMCEHDVEFCWRFCCLQVPCQRPPSVCVFIGYCLMRRHNVPNVPLFATVRIPAHLCKWLGPHQLPEKERERESMTYKGLLQNDGNNIFTWRLQAEFSIGSVFKNKYKIHILKWCAFTLLRTIRWQGKGDKNNFEIHWYGLCEEQPSYFGSFACLDKQSMLQWKLSSFMNFWLSEVWAGTKLARKGHIRQM